MPFDPRNGSSSSIFIATKRTVETTTIQLPNKIPKWIILSCHFHRFLLWPFKHQIKNCQKKGIKMDVELIGK
jgi:hypothetical protein